MLRPYKTVEELPFEKSDVITLRAIDTKYVDTYEVKGFEIKNELYVCVTGGKLRVSFLCENFEILINGNWCPMGVEE